jgi:hypothetical protein
MKAEKPIAPCGIDCFNCEVYEGNIIEDTRNKMAAYLKIDVSNVACKGCRWQNGCRLHWGKCDTLDCVKKHGVEYCFECTDFPCEMLCPSRESAEKYPHNLKLYNLCRMRLVGIDAWINEAAQNRMRYFKGKFVVGKGSVLD